MHGNGIAVDGQGSIVVFVGLHDGRVSEAQDESNMERVGVVVPFNENRLVEATRGNAAVFHRGGEEPSLKRAGAELKEV